MTRRGEACLAPTGRHQGASSGEGAFSTARYRAGLPGLQTEEFRFNHQARSPQVRTLSVTAPPPNLRHLALITRASRFHARSPCSATPSIRSLSIGSQFMLHASFPLSVSLVQLRFASFVVIYLRRDLSPQVCAQAGRT
jgi:hypothetical protein